METFLF